MKLLHVMSKLRIIGTAHSSCFSSIYFTHFFFNVPCLFSPHLKLRSFTFDLTTFRWPPFSHLFLTGIYFFYLHQTSLGTQLGRKTRDVCITPLLHSTSRIVKGRIWFYFTRDGIISASVQSF
jgi:hypothetical protein